MCDNQLPLEEYWESRRLLTGARLTYVENAFPNEHRAGFFLNAGIGFLEQISDWLLFVAAHAEQQVADEELARWGDPLLPLSELPGSEMRRIVDALNTGTPYRLGTLFLEYQDITSIDFDNRGPEQHHRLRLLLPLVKEVLQRVVEPDEEENR